jgi:hypothetical protein
MNVVYVENFPRKTFSQRIFFYVKENEASFFGIFHLLALLTLTRGVSHCGLAIYIKKKYLKAKRRILETQIFHHAKIYQIFKISSKSLSRYYL